MFRKIPALFDERKGIVTIIAVIMKDKRNRKL